jgi:Methyltransferase domain
VNFKGMLATWGQMAKQVSEVPGWFPQENQITLLELIYKHHIQTVIEIGSFLGKSAVFFARWCRWVGCVDPFVLPKTGNEGEIYVLEQVRADHRNFFRDFQENTAGLRGIHPYVGTSETWAPRLRPVDLVYIDGEHSYGSVRRDIDLYLPKAKFVICGDDYTHAPGVRKAVDELLPGRLTMGPFWWWEIK